MYNIKHYNTNSYSIDLIVNDHLLVLDFSKSYIPVFVKHGSSFSKINYLPIWFAQKMSFAY